MLIAMTMPLPMLIPVLVQGTDAPMYCMNSWVLGSLGGSQGPLPVKLNELEV